MIDIPVLIWYTILHKVDMIKKPNNFTMDFAMCSEEGNKKILNIIWTSRNYKETLPKLKELSEKEGFEEAFDYEVQEKVFEYMKKVDDV